MNMTTLEVGKKLVELCKAGKNKEAAETLYAPDIVSVEAGGPPGKDRATRGVKALAEKSQWWQDNHTIHSSATEGPWPHDDRFIVKFTYDVTFKPENKRFTLEEAALFTVKDGKVVKEEFFYAMG
jgi:ketosteroid isomerase-like protein